MKKHILAAAAALAFATASYAQDDVLRITFNDGSSQTFSIAEIKEMTFEDAQSNAADSYAGSYSGINTVVVGGSFTYTSAETTYTVTAADDGTLTLNMPQYILKETVMGNLTLGAYTISGIAYDEEKGAYYRRYDTDGLKLHFTAEKDGNVSIDKDYSFVETSEVTIEKTGDGLKVTNSFALKGMPFPITATFDGKK